MNDRDWHKREKTLEVEPQLVMIPEREALLRTLIGLIEASQVSIDTTCSWETCAQALSDLPLIYHRALDRGVKIRYVISAPPIKETIPEIMEGFVEIPCLNSGLQINILLRDLGFSIKKKCTLFCTPRVSWFSGFVVKRCSTGGTSPKLL